MRDDQASEITELLHEILAELRDLRSDFSEFTVYNVYNLKTVVEDITGATPGMAGASLEDIRTALDGIGDSIDLK